MLQEYASNGVASESLLRAFFAPAMEKFGASFEQLLNIFKDQELLFEIEEREQEPEYIVPIRLSTTPPQGFERE